MRAREFLSEAAYDAKIASMANKWQNLVPESVSDIQWAKKLGRQDIVFWYLHYLENYYLNLILKYRTDDSLDDREKKANLNLANHLTNNIPAFREQLQHYLGYTYVPGIANYRFDIRRSPKSTFNELEQIVKAWQEKQTRESPVYPKPGDKIIIDYGASAWWLLDRGYCEEEGRSGDHCGNIAGRRQGNQRILSYRRRDSRDTRGWHVILTFVLHTDGNSDHGKLGEMKAKSNNKPAPSQHNAILDLLLSPTVDGIISGGYIPESNFSVFDLNEQQLRIIDQQKPQLIRDQIETEMDGEVITELPEWLKLKYKTDLDRVYGKYIAYASPELLEKIFKAIGRYVTGFMNELIFDYEMDDDGWQDYRQQEALKRGYYTSDLSQEELAELSPSELWHAVDIDYDQVNDDPELNNYYEYNDDLRGAMSEVEEVTNSPGSYIKQTTRDLEDDDGDDPGYTMISNLDRVYRVLIDEHQERYRDSILRSVSEYVENNVGIYPSSVQDAFKKGTDITRIDHEGQTWFVVETSKYRK